MASLAIKNLFHEKVRFAVTLTGIIFSVILTAVQLGIFQGFIAASTDIIDKSNADLWIVSQNVSHVEQGVAFPESNLYKVLEVAGVSRAEKQIVSLGAQAKKPDAIFVDKLYAEQKLGVKEVGQVIEINNRRARNRKIIVYADATKLGGYF